MDHTSLVDFMRRLSETSELLNTELQDWMKSNRLTFYPMWHNDTRPPATVENPQVVGIEYATPSFEWVGHSYHLVRLQLTVFFT